jgi:hypothetical protein
MITPAVEVAIRVYGWKIYVEVGNAQSRSTSNIEVHEPVFSVSYLALNNLHILDKARPKDMYPMLVRLGTDAPVLE